MIFGYFKQFFKFFKDYKRAFIKYSVLSLIAAIMELFGVALIYPFVLKLLSENSDKKLIFAFGTLIIFLFLLKNLFMIFYTFVQSNFTNNFEFMIKNRIINFYLNSEYQKTSKLSLAQKNKVFNLLVPNIMNNFILRLLNLNINLLITVLIAIFITIKFPLATLISLVCATALIKIQNCIYKPVLSKVSEKMSEAILLNEQAYNEAIINLKGVKISNKEKYFYDNYSKTLKQYFDNNKKMSFLTLIPPYVIEPFAIVLLFILLLVIAFQNADSVQRLIASFALVATAVFRLTPAISRIQVNLNGINSALPMVKEFVDFYSENEIANVQKTEKKCFCEFKNTLELRHLSFGYEKDKLILKDINVLINRGDCIGIAGLSGAGKTTLADIIAGLYEPRTGEILVDGEKKKLPLKIGYIPQEFTLISGSIKNNVIFGNNYTNDDDVINALKKAQLYDFIVNNYTEGINAEPFTDSIGLSQGQKQRLVIARALYSNPDILILDEATSSLDIKTEDEIKTVLNELKGEKTIIVIAHRLSTIECADKILYMEDGIIKESGTFEELKKNSQGFAYLVNKNIKDKD